VPPLFVEAGGDDVGMVSACLRKAALRCKIAPSGPDLMAILRAVKRMIAC